MQYPPNARIIRTMCSGRVAIKFVERAFRNGAAAVLVAGCHLNDCHYINANYQTKKRVEKLWSKLEKLGIDKNRLQLEWISAAEGEKFKEIKGIQALQTQTARRCRGVAEEWRVAVGAALHLEALQIELFNR